MLPITRYPFVFLAVWLAVVSPASAAAGRIQGTVVDTQGARIPNAAIELRCDDSRQHLTASATGEFDVASLPSATRCQLTASSESFEPQTVAVDGADTGPVRIVLHVRRFASEVVVTPTRGRETSTFSTPETLSVTSRRDIDSRPHVLLGQVLREEPGILVQQTTSAQVSPIIRGFTGQSNVYLVDGVRLNTGAWRSGPSQYMSWVGAGPIDTIEVLRGTGSVQYGSDALGGTIQFLTTPALSSVAAASRLHGSVEVRGASADSSYGAQGDLAFQDSGTMVRVGARRDRMGDLRAGGGLDSHSAVTRFLGLPSTILGTRQRATAFDQGGGYGVVDLALPGSATLHAIYMHETQTGASRYDRLMGGEGLFRSGFDPQTLDFGVARYSRPDVGGFGFTAAWSVNRQADGRFEQARPVARLDRQEATTTAIGYQAQAHRSVADRHDLTFGAELYDETTDAFRELVEVNGTITAARPDIPTGTTYRNFGAFAQQTYVAGSRLTVRGGVRYADFRFVTTPDPVLGVTAEDVTMRSVTFQTAAAYLLNDHLNLTANVTRGFRAPNAADFGSVGLTGGGGFEIAPSKALELGALVGSSGGTDARSTSERVPNLRPEVVYQFDYGVKARLGRFSGAVNGFDMELHDFIQRRALVFDTSIVGTTISGFQVVRQDAFGLAYIAQDVRPIATRVNIDRARIAGFDAEGDVQINRAWSAHGHFSMSNGRILPQGEYIRRMIPPMGMARVRWSGDRLWAEGVASFAGAQTRLNSADLSDARIGALRTRSSIATFFNGTATDLGLAANGVLVSTGETLAAVQNRVLGTATQAPLYTAEPGYATFGLRGGMQITPQFDVTVIGENLGDVNYRLYGSGLDAPGANLQVRTRFRF